MFATVSEPSTAGQAGPPKPVQTARRRASSRRQYEKRKAVGLCGYFGCSARPQPTRHYCVKHLRQMARKIKKIVQKRKDEGLCVSCGKRPQFWGVRCIICRQTLKSHPLPLAARRALRSYREAEQKLEIEQREAKARCAVRKMLATGNVQGDRATALKLYAGLDTGQWLNGREVAKLMGISRERVRQLLYPCKVILSEMLDGDVPWKPLAPKAVSGTREKSWRHPIGQKPKKSEPRSPRFGDKSFPESFKHYRSKDEQGN